MTEISLYVDGSCRIHDPGRPMFAGIRAVLVATGLVKNYSVALGPGTCNLAELRAVEEGLKRIIKSRAECDVTVYSDSLYAIGCLESTYQNVRINAATVSSIKLLMREFKSVRFVKVKGHSNHIGNDAANSLAKRKLS